MGGAHLPFDLFVRTPSEIVLQLEVKASDTIEEVKARLASLEGTPVERQRLMRHGAALPNQQSLEACGVAAGHVLLLVPRLGELGQRNFAAVRLPDPKPLASGIPRPRVPLVCTDIARPFPMSLEFISIAEYQSFMLSLQRQVQQGRRSHLRHFFASKPSPRWDENRSRPAWHTSPRWMKKRRIWRFCPRIRCDLQCKRV
eukprot:symbB.v1.2.021650.t1/scaffold1746.1/size103363/8